MTTPKLLLADDSASVRKIVEMTFAAEGINVTSVGDAQAAMLTFIDLQPDIVLLDVGLAGTSGYQICLMIKQDDGTRHIPVLLLVGAYEPFDEELAKQAAADGHFTKPLIPIRNLVDEVRALLGMAPKSVGLAAEEVLKPETANYPQTEDIEDLYSSSLYSKEEPQVETAQDIYLVPTGDDDLIETIPLPLRHSSKADQTFELSLDQDMNEDASPPSQQVPQTPVNGDAEIEPTPLDTVDHPPAGLDDHTVESQRPDTEGDTDDIYLNPANYGFSAEDSVPLSWERSDEPFSVEHQTIEQVEWKGEKTGDEVVLAPVEDVSGESYVVTLDEARSQATSAEMIEQITQRVIERLSDRVVREIAQQTVPQIAEKLIREALEEEKKV